MKPTIDPEEVRRALREGIWDSRGEHAVHEAAREWLRMQEQGAPDVQTQNALLSPGPEVELSRLKADYARRGVALEHALRTIDDMQAQIDAAYEQGVRDAADVAINPPGYCSEDSEVREWGRECGAAILRLLERRGARPKLYTQAELDAAVAKEREAIAERLRQTAECYPQSSDGRNTFLLEADWVCARSAKVVS